MTGPLTLSVAPSHRILSDLANFDRVAHREHRCLLLSFVLVVFLSTFDLFALIVESLDFLDKIGLSVVGSHSKVLTACSILRFTSRGRTVSSSGCRVINWHFDSSLAHKVCSFSSKAHRHFALSGVWVVSCRLIGVVGWLLLNLLRFVLVVLLTIEKGSARLRLGLFLHLGVGVLGRGLLCRGSRLLLLL